MNQSIRQSVRTSGHSPVGEPGHIERCELLALGLIAEGWCRGSGRLTSPGGEVWLPEAPLDLHALRDRTASRLYRLLLRRDDAEVTLIADLRSLLISLEDLSDDGGLETFFRPVSDAVKAYVGHLQLRVMKYPEAQPTWQLFDRHPGGGIAIIELMKTGPSTLCVSLLWRRRYDRDREEVRVWRSGELPNSGPVLAGLLPSAHEYLLDWEPPQDDCFSGILFSPFCHPRELPLVFADHG